MTFEVVHIVAALTTLVGVAGLWLALGARADATRKFGSGIWLAGMLGAGFMLLGHSLGQDGSVEFVVGLAVCIVGALGAGLIGPARGEGSSTGGTGN
jgi:hypothetical protein